MHEIFTSPFFRPTKALFFLLFSSLLAFTANAQNSGRFNNWYFGSNAGVSFASGSPVALTNGALLTTEGSASISDVNGNLLFYTDGVTVWNRNHVAMTNGIGLHGHASSTQSAIIVQKPGSANLYYIFTADADAGANGIKYSEVNMTLSAGLGAVTANKNIALRTPSCEKITAVRHCNNTDLWIVSHDWNSNNFRTWLVTAAGVNTTPIVSAAGITATGVSQGTYGQLKANPDGNKLVAAYYGLSTGGVNKMEAYDFNNSTGVISNALTLASDVGLYGAEFSPNGRVVYGGTNQGLLLQFNLCAGSNAAIVASRYVIGNLGPFIGSMQLGPDNKVYVARNQTSLSVINNPNTPGVGCGYTNGAISLSGRSSRMGLPNMASFYIRPDVLPFTSLANCLDVAFTAPSVLTSSNSCNGAANAIQSVQWNFGDPASGASNTSTVLNPSHAFSAVGTYSVRLVLNLGCYNDTLIQNVNVSGFTVNTSNTPASCGSSNGTATATPATAGVYTYLWSNGQQTATATGLAAGNYSCTITASSGCTSTANVTVTSGGSMSVNVNATNAACFGANGSATASASGGTSPYSYVWSNGANGATLSLPAGSYSVTVSDAAGCTAIQNVSITQPIQLSATFTATSPLCNGSTGSASVSVSGGTAPYTYAWSTGSALSAINGLAAGNHSVIVNDSRGCTASASGSITIPTALTATLTTSNPLCFGGSNGSASVSVSGGVAPYTYLWSTGAVTSAVTNRPAGAISVTITDANGCSISRNSTLTAPAQIQASVSVTPPACGQSNGSATASATGGSAPYTFVWSTGTFSNQLNGISAGNYSLIVTDNSGCNDTENFSISANFAPTVNLTVNQQVSCAGGSNGSIQSVVNGGTAPYNFAWNTGAVSSGLSGVQAGNYSLTVTDAIGCTASANAVVNQPTAITVSGTVANATCGGSNGSIAAQVSGGTAPYAYSWNTTPAQVSATASGLQSGNYILTVTDANGCIATLNKNVQSSGSISASAAVLNQVSCNGGSNGSAQVNVNGGTAPFVYSWSNGLSSATAQNLNAGNYSVTVEDANGCAASANVVITQPAAIGVSGTVANATCGGSDGLIAAQVSGGTAPYAYSWNTSPAQVSVTATGLSAGNYILTVTDANGCSATLNENVQSSGSISASAAVLNQVSCNGGNNGSAQVSVIGGTAPFVYTWSNGVSSATAQNLNAGNYSVTVEDANGCAASANVVITQPTAITVSGTVVNATCGGSDGSIAVQVSGGIAPYSYSWNTAPAQVLATATGLSAGNYILTVTDANGCTATLNENVQSSGSISASASVLNQVSCNGGSNGSAQVSVNGGTAPFVYSWSNGVSSATAQNLNAGNYSVTVEDANGCAASANVVITQPAAITVSGTVANATCGGSDGSISAQVSGGTAPYSYSWNTSPAQVSATATGLSAGNYMLTVTDANGCIATLNQNVQSSGSISASASVLNQVSCNGGSNGSAQVSVNGGTAPFIYTWSNGASSATAQNLNAGNYSVAVEDANGCVAAATINITEPNTFQISITSSYITCNGLNNGTASVSGNGGTSPYSFAWSNGETTNSISGLQASLYSVIATDAAGCVVNDMITISEPAVLSVSETAINITCNGMPNGEISLDVIGGQVPYVVSWNDGSNSLQRNGLSAGFYAYSLTDASGCVVNGDAEITEPALLAVTGVATNLNCFGSNDGSIVLQITGGREPYSIAWNSGQTLPSIENLDNGMYSASIQDAAGCQINYSATLTEPEIISLSSEVTPSSCITSDGTISVTASGGLAPYEYSIDGLPYQSSPNFISLIAGNHAVSIRDATGCEREEMIAVPSPANLSLTVVQTTDVTCPGAYDGTAELQINGGTAPYMISWSSEEATLTASMLSAGTHYVTVTDAAGCDFTTTFEIGAPQPMLATALITDVHCFGGSDGAIALSPNGGTGAVVIAWENGSSAAQLNDLSAGSYALELSDENGCLVRDTFAVLQPLQPLAVAADIIVPACGLNGGSIALEVIGGTAPYNYTWSHDAALNGELAGNLAAGIYSITIEDANQCSLNEFYTLSSPAPLVAQIDSLHHVTCFGNNNGEAFVTITGGTAPYQYDWGTGLQSALAPFAAGTYSMEIRDAGGCQATLNFSIIQPDELFANLSTEDVSCFGSNDGRAIASVEGGTQPYAYTWSNGANQTTNENLTAGNYFLTVNDANGCSINASATVSEPAALAIEMLSENPGCNSNNSGSVIAMVSGGVEGYAYIWNTGSSANAISGLSSGTYEVQVTDANACAAQAEVTLVSGAAFSVFIDGDTSICIGEQTVLMATTNLSHSNYSISWGHGVNTESVAVNPAADDVFTVVFTDSLGCSASASAMVHVNTIPAIGISATVSEGCAPLCTELEAPDGALSYNWSFTDGRVAQGQDLTLCFDNAGIYGVALSVIDSNGCSAQMTWTETIEVHAVPVAAFTASPTEISLDDPNVSFSSQSTGADSYMYFFGDPSNNYVTTSTAQHAYSDTGSFEVTLLVTNEHGCKDDAVRTIHVGGFTAFYIPNAFSPDGDGTNDVFMPKASGLAANGYEMQIFDRWGNLIFVTNDWDKGWDGTYMGNPVPSEQYVCKVRYYDGQGRANAQIGSVVIAE